MLIPTFDKLRTPHFSRDELACHCGCGRMEISDSFLGKLEDLRRAYNKPMVITSGYRCPAYNKKVSHSGSDGPHTKAAVDIAVSGPNAYELLVMAAMVGFTGIGINQQGPYSGRFIHLDDLPVSTQNHPRPRLWSY